MYVRTYPPKFESTKNTQREPQTAQGRHFYVRTQILLHSILLCCITYVRYVRTVLLPMMVIVLLLVICSSDVAYVLFCLVRRSDSRCPVLSLGQVARDALFVFLWSGGYGCPIIFIYLVRWLLLSRVLFAWRRGS